ncbi:MAG: hypothetical protein HOM14_07620 [Gammaproteobacteria bacterium]|nr:hypothetical protein [Gammaproteobacteria bacterium]MBT4860331.1 hypothetical protein [Gammaproteobacteria bacterium]MBT6551207.1 hypothetical protein [Gammaproteobacteria bacterium]MBT6703080.1 hypothetical protein [Gammaproteobacteria bacterium]MBT7046289.1 hypothetical protein [Gammaproteobacteria bacterium]
MIIPRIHAWWLLWLSVVITIAIVAASQLFTQRISLLLDRQAAELLAADLLISSSEALPENFINLAKQLGLKTATTISLRTAIFIDDEAQLIELKAVSENYPLRGTLERKSSLLGESEKTELGPQPGEVWIDSKIAAQLHKDIELGLQSLKANWIVSYEPDRGGSLFNMAPRILMSQQNLESTGLLVPGSRAKYHLLVAGEQQAIELFEIAIKPLLAEGQRLQTLENARPEMRNALDKTRKFFALSIVLTLVIAMIAIAITARYSASRESIKVAVMRTFGISSKRLISFYVSQLLKVWLLSIPLGLLLGYLAQFPLQWSLGLWFGTRLPETGYWPYLIASLIGLISLIGFSIPHVLNVLETPPMQVFRQINQKLSRSKSIFLLMSSLVTLFLVLMLIVNELQMAALLFVVILFFAAFIPLVLKLILKVLMRFSQKKFWLSAYVLTRLFSGQRNALFVMSGFSLTLLSVLLISQVKDQLLQDWEMQLPQDKPNFFLVNIPTKEAKPLTQFLHSKQVSTSVAYAMVRTRLSAINGVDIKSIKFESERSNHFKNHVFNMSFTDEVPADNKIVEGLWDTGGFSVEQGMAKTLNLKLGDTLQFSVQGAVFEAKINNIRTVVWENFQPNFYILAPRHLLEPQPQTWLMSAFIDKQQKVVLKPLLQQFPTVTLLDISELMQRIKGIIRSASAALEFFFLFATLSAIIVLLSALNTTNRQREMEIALLQVLGANRRQKLFSQISEFVLMGLLVGSFAALFASLTGWGVGYLFFDLSYTFSIGLWVVSLLSSVLLITIMGTLFIRRSFSISPMSLLRS